MSEEPAQEPKRSFAFFKGGENIVSTAQDEPFNWSKAAAAVRSSLSDAMNARNVAFLLGSGCSSFLEDVEDLGFSEEVGIPTMKTMAAEFVGKIGDTKRAGFATQAERDVLKSALGIDISSTEYATNLERLMEVLHSFQFALRATSTGPLAPHLEALESVITKVRNHIIKSCTWGPFADGNNTVAKLYEAFYRKLVYRDRALPRPWVFTTNYDLFNEVAMDRIGIPYCNGFSGVVERRFNPATFRYSLAEQLDITSAKWTAVDNFVYLCKLHGSVNWIEEATGLFPIRELQDASASNGGHVIIYPTPAKQNASFGSPYSDMFREFQKRIVREQSVLFVIGYSFSDEHINNIIFQALTVPTFRMIAFVPPDAGGVIAQLRELGDPRIWLIGGDGPGADIPAHYFATVVDKFMPDPPGDRVDTAVTRILESFMKKTPSEAPDAL